MHTSLTSTAVLLAAGMILLQALPAQQTPSASSTPSTATRTHSATATSKTHTATTAKKTTTPAPLVLKTDEQKASYAIGMSVGKRLHEDDAQIDPAVLLRGLKDALAGSKLALTDEEARTALINLQQVTEAARKKKNEDFLAANKAKPGVVTLPSGLEYKIIQQGTGPKPTADDSVVCNYKGTFIDGKQFDSSYDRGEPATFPVKGVIKGWTEALQLMPVGSKWQLVVPADLAYGPQGNRAIPPNSTLVFDVELMKIADKPKPEPEAPKPQTAEPQASQPQAAQPQATAPSAAQPQAPQPQQPQTSSPK